MNKKQALKLYKSKWWKNKTAEEIVQFQLYERRLCMDFGDFYEAVEKVLDRPVWTHEFARPEDLRREFEKKDPKRTVEESMALLEELAGTNQSSIWLLTKMSGWKIACYICGKKIPADEYLGNGGICEACKRSMLHMEEGMKKRRNENE